MVSVPTKEQEGGGVGPETLWREGKKGSWEAVLKLIPLLRSLGVTQMSWEHIPALREGPCNHMHVFCGRSL